ncbi:MAG: nucleotidyl transferase AbiEii/AbiGii toxin family protein [Coxiellaceae bacterium]|nr:nucleotidyl transferase AbiEii/AbiGii toxin family protein [Coxiellaceae bacterium]
MLKTFSELLAFYGRQSEFLACLEYTASKTGFRAELIEKDFLCSLILSYLYKDLDTPLIFKGGTSLAKIHAGFYRLSEDLDFSLSIAPDASRQQRSDVVKPFKEIVNALPQYLPIFNLQKPITGTNASRQYNATFSYASQIGPVDGTILVEISVREGHLQSPIVLEGCSILEDFLTENRCVSPCRIRSFTKYEAYAEKIRAALTRTKPAIRDFYDIHYAVKRDLINFTDSEYINLVRDKLSLQEVGEIDLSDKKLEQLKRQVDAELLPTLRVREVEAHDFNLNTTFAFLKRYAEAYLCELV